MAGCGPGQGSALPGHRAGALEGSREPVLALAVSSEEVGGFLEGTETSSLGAGEGDGDGLPTGGGSGSRQRRERLVTAAGLRGPEPRGPPSKRGPA